MTVLIVLAVSRESKINWNASSFSQKKHLRNTHLPLTSVQTRSNPHAQGKTLLFGNIVKESQFELRSRHQNNSVKFRTASRFGLK